MNNSLTIYTFRTTTIHAIIGSDIQREIYNNYTFADTRTIQEDMNTVYI
jgi:hypothetical protein